MSTQIVKRQMPEECELAKKRAVLAALEERLAEHELELATLQAELHEFEQPYLRTVGAKYAEFDEIAAQVAEARACLFPGNQSAWQEAEQARAQAPESAGAVAKAASTQPREKFKPSDEIKKLYREIARQLHPCARPVLHRTRSAGPIGRRDYHRDAGGARLPE
jgi:hypothetical protein